MTLIFFKLMTCEQWFGWKTHQGRCISCCTPNHAHVISRRHDVRLTKWFLYNTLFMRKRAPNRWESTKICTYRVLYGIRGTEIRISSNQWQCNHRRTTSLKIKRDGIINKRRYRNRTKWSINDDESITCRRRTRLN